MIIVRITTSKSRNSESFYITQSYTNANGKSTPKTIRKLGTLAELSAQLHTDRDGVVEWANEQARLETLKYKSEKEDATVMIPFHSNLESQPHAKCYPLAIFSFDTIHHLYVQKLDPLFLYHLSVLPITVSHTRYPE